MPLYEYICLDCAEKFDALRSINDADKPFPCPRCASASTRRTLSVFAAHCEGKILTGNSSSGCSSCAGGNCSSCGH